MVAAIHRRTGWSAVAVLAAATSFGCWAPACAAAELARVERIPVTTPVFETPYGPDGIEERSLWLDVEESERKLRNSPQVIRDPALNAYVQAVLCRVVSAKSCAAVRLYIVRDPHMNASMAPNGMLQVNSGMLLRLSSEAQLAYVLGHEFAHYEHRHTLLLFREYKKRSNTSAWLALSGIGLIAAIGVEQGIYTYSRDMEREADMGGLQRLGAAGYALSEAPAPWKLMRAEMDGTAAERNRKSKVLKETSVYATHPPTAERIAYIEGEAAKQTAGGETGAEHYRQVLAPWLPVFIEDQAKLNDFGASEAMITALARGGWTPLLYFARGEIYRLRAGTGDLDKAVSFYGEGIAAGATMPALWRGRGLAMLKLGRANEAKADFKEYVTRAPDASDRAMMIMLAGGN